MAAHIEAGSLFRVDGMVAVITGGGSGIGLIMAKALANHGASKVYILGRRMDVLESAAQQHSALVPIQCDVTSKESLQAAVDKITAEAGFVNLVVANSGAIGTPNGFDPTKSIKEVREQLFTNHSVEDFTSAFQINVAGVLFTIGAFLELLDEGNKKALDGGFGAPDKPGSKVLSVQSQVIITSSIAAFSRMHISTPAYGGSKAAVMWLMKNAATNLAPYGIRVNALAPGLFPSELAAGLIATRKPEEEGYDDPKFIPARKFGGDEEMTGTLLYLVSRAGAYCNGTHLLMDGGRGAVMKTSY
ncbi:NAD(P)-binding protein [Thozetella sp. PMI_491]|nr:NAD(P)-binding protein [Thozetella sp. PMI_491]